MSTGTSQTLAVRFEGFRLDLNTGELWKDGTPAKLQPQPSKVLALLASKLGQLVTREEICQQVWGSETFVDFDQGLNSCIKQIRAVLGDDPDAPRFVETVPRRGYRFIAPIEKVSVSTSSEKAVAAPMSATIPRYRRRSSLLGLLLAMAAAAALFGWYRARSSVRSPADKATLVVLPFQNLSGDPDQDFLSDGLTEEMITQLARLDPARLGVIARTSASQYRDTKKQADQIGRELGVNYILEGSVRRAGQRVRVSVQLIRVHDQSHVWAEIYERDMRDVLALEAELAETVAQEIRIKLAPATAVRLSRQQTNPEAHEAYLRGRYHWRKLAPDEFEKAIQFFHAALDKDPNYAPAYAGLADSYYGLSNMRLPPSEAMERARMAASRALELDPQLPEAHLSMAFVKAFYDWDWSGADAQFRSAIELDPSFADAHVWHGAFLALMGRLDESSDELKRAQELDPLSINAISTRALPLYLAGKYDDAIAQTRRALELEPNYTMALAGLGVLHEAKGEPRTAIREFEEARKLNDSPELLAYLGHAYALAGERNSALKILAELNVISKRKYVSPFNFALVHDALGQNEQALDWLERGYQERAEGMINLKTDPRLQNLRSHPRFQALLRTMAFP